MTFALGSKFSFCCHGHRVKATGVAERMGTAEYPIPSFALSPFGFEADFDWKPVIRWFERHWRSAITYSAIYLLFILLLQEVMQKRKKLDASSLFFFWNAGLAIFSIVGALRTLPELVQLVSEEGFHSSICAERTLHTPTYRLWGALFALSKVFEFGDTILLVLKKRPLSFLHVYHHASVLLITWYGMADRSGSGRWFVTMNYSVHAVMYTYFAVHALRLFSNPKPFAMCVTAMQILQMVIGVTVNLYGYRVKASRAPCDVSDESLIFAAVIYSSYLVLFSRFFYHAYVLRQHNVEKRN